MTASVLIESDYEWPEEPPLVKQTPREPIQLPDAEVSDLIASGALTEEAWAAHLQGASWQIHVQR